MKVYYNHEVSDKFRKELFQRLERFMFDEKSKSYKLYGKEITKSREELYDDFEFLWPDGSAEGGKKNEAVSSTIKAFFFLDSFFFGFLADVEVDETFEQFLEDIGIVFPFPFFVEKRDESKQVWKGEY